MWQSVLLTQMRWGLRSLSAEGGLTGSESPPVEEISSSAGRNFCLFPWGPGPASSLPVSTTPREVQLLYLGRSSASLFLKNLKVLWVLRLVNRVTGEPEGSTRSVQIVML